MSEAPFVLSAAYRVRGPVIDGRERQAAVPEPGDCPGCRVGHLRSQRHASNDQAGVIALRCDLPGCGQEVLMPTRQVAVAARHSARPKMVVLRSPVPEFSA